MPRNWLCFQLCAFEFLSNGCCMPLELFCVLFLYRLVEEADYKNTAELFASKKADDNNIDNFIPKSENDFLEYAELISNKLRPFEVY